MTEPLELVGSAGPGCQGDTCAVPETLQEDQP